MNPNNRDPVWGNVEVGDRVTTFGRHGTGQPPIQGTLVSIERGEALIHLFKRPTVTRRRSISNVKRLP